MCPWQYVVNQHRNGYGSIYRASLTYRRPGRVLNSTLCITIINTGFIDGPELMKNLYRAKSLRSSIMRDSTSTSVSSFSLKGSSPASKKIFNDTLPHAKLTLFSTKPEAFLFIGMNGLRFWNQSIGTWLKEECWQQRSAVLYEPSLHYRLTVDEKASEQSDGIESGTIFLQTQARTVPPSLIE